MRERIGKMLQLGIGRPERFLSLLAVRYILNRQKDRARLRIRIEDLAGVEQHHFPSDMLKFVCHLKVPERGMRGENVLQQLTQFRDIPLSVPEVINETLLRLLPHGLKRLVERPVRFHHLQVLVQDHQRLPHRFYNRFGEVETALCGINIDQHQHGAVDSCHPVPRTAGCAANTSGRASRGYRAVSDRRPPSHPTATAAGRAIRFEAEDR